MVESELLGWTGLLLSFLAALLLVHRRREIAVILLVAFFFRIGMALFHYYVTPLPDGVQDAVTFERYAWEWGQNGLISAWQHYPGMNAYFYSWLMSLVYAMTSRSLLLLQSINIVAGVLGVYATYRLAKLLWGEYPGRKAAWVMATFPTVVQYSVLPMREVWVVLFFVMALIEVVLWSKDDRLIHIVRGVTFFVVAAFFHGGMFVAALAFMGVACIRSSKKTINAVLLRNHINLSLFFALIFVFVFFVFFVMSGVAIHKLGSARDMVDLEVWNFYFQTRDSGEAKYPGWMQPSNPVDFVWVVPAKVLYLMFSPFPWDVKKISHVIGLIDGFFYLVFCYLMWRNRRYIFSDPATRSIFVILIGLAFTFGVGTGNFGTAIRHRAKLLVALVVLVSPWIPLVRLKMKVNP